MQIKTETLNKTHSEPDKSKLHKTYSLRVTPILIPSTYVQPDVVGTNRVAIL